ncbi:hypothetical protein EV175_001785 [Coemansia sp. RSA 1933]|nr:hypothetical protein EV175_001785 [Coemansia sp. RSA 1933]
MLKRTENGTGKQHTNNSTIKDESEEEAAVLDALTQALQFSESREERANIQLAIELRKHLVEERHEYMQEREVLESKWQRARDSHQRSTESLQRDTQRVVGKQQPAVGIIGGLTVKRKAVRDAKQSADFSRMMLRGAETKVVQASEDLKALDARFDRALKRREVEFRLAFVACESVLRRYTASSAKHPERRSALAKSPVVPTRSLPMLPSAHRSISSAKSPQPPVVVPKMPSTYRSASAILPPPPPPPPPPPLLSSTGTLPFTITADGSSETPQTQFRIQRRIPREYLPANISAQLAEEEGVLSDAAVRRLVVGPLRTCICGALKASIPRIGAVDVVEGMAGFGADAYLVVRSREPEAAEVLRLPISTVSTLLCSTSSEVAQPSANQLAIRKSLGRGSDPPLAETAVRHAVQLISTETMACNAGLLVSAEGVLLVRRTTVQAVLVSKMALFSAEDSKTCCHPVAVVVWFVAGLLEKIKRQNSDGKPRRILAPPLF